MTAIPSFPFKDCNDFSQTTTNNCEAANVAYAAQHRDLLVSNHSVTDIETTAREEILFLESRSNELKSRLMVSAPPMAQLSSELEQTLHAIALRKAIIAPIRHLPNEVLADIFWQAHDSESWSPFSMTGIPWVVGQVCSRWRHISISSPWLWSSFLCPTYDDAEDEPEGGNDETYVMEKEKRSSRIQQRQVEIIQQCLLRSGNCPLDFYLEASNLPVFRKIAQLLCANSDRWRDVQLSPALSIFHLVASGIGPVSHLERFKCTWNWSVLLREDALRHSFAVAPRLRKLHIHISSSWLSSEIPPFPWSQLQILHLDTANDSNPFEILKHCVNLVECRLSQTSGYVAPPSQSVGDFDHLRILSLFPASDLSAFGSMPVLEELRFGGFLGLTSLNDVERKWSRLQVLILPIIWTEQECNIWLSILKECTNLITLHVRQPGHRLFGRLAGTTPRDASPLIEILNLSSTDAPAVPVLQHLAVTMYDEYELNRWFETIRSRCYPSPQFQPLKSLKIRHPSNLLGDIKGALNELKKIGLEVSLELAHSQ
ncbi:hypothetical protein C8J56DRAFT_953827 [Mycena floridula]|nr:hypothetical protein C8J56DRAFT_953827 [Mycena floridula]